MNNDNHTPAESKQPFEQFPALHESIEHAANFWKTDSQWSHHLQCINDVCQQTAALQERVREEKQHAEKLMGELKNYWMKHHYYFMSWLTDVGHEAAWLTYCREHGLTSAPDPSAE